MCEIICLIGLWRMLGTAAEEKGRPAIWFQLMGIGMYLGGEVFGFIAGSVLLGGSGGGMSLGPYVCALGGGLAGAVLSFVIVTVMPAALPPPRNYPPMPPGR